MRAIGHKESAGDLDALGVQLGEFAEERIRIEYDAIAHDALGARVQNAGRNLVQHELPVTNHDSVPGVGAALIADHHVGLLGEHVNELPLALVAPLRPDDNNTIVLAVKHQLTSGDAPRRAGKRLAFPSFAARSSAARSAVDSAPAIMAS